MGQGHDVAVFEPEDAWSAQNLVADGGTESLRAFAHVYPELESTRYRLEQLDLSRALSNADMVLVHEWNSPALVSRVGEHHAAHPEYTLFFHDTHHRVVTAPADIAQYDLRHYDAVLAFGEVLRRKYLSMPAIKHAFVWHEAADVRKFQPLEGPARGDLVWIGNFGDDERTAELQEFLLEPVRKLGLRARVYGVRYPDSVLSLLGEAGVEYGGYLPNWEVPRVFAEHRVTVHVPRRPYAQNLPGIPTIRPFEAMACGIPLVCAPWADAEGLFESDVYLKARDGTEMLNAIRLVLENPGSAAAMAARARSNIMRRHTCTHRVAELLAFRRAIAAERGASATVELRATHGATNTLSTELSS